MQTVGVTEAERRVTEEQAAAARIAAPKKKQKEEQAVAMRRKPVLLAVSPRRQEYRRAKVNLTTPPTISMFPPEQPLVSGQLHRCLRGTRTWPHRHRDRPSGARAHPTLDRLSRGNCRSRMPYCRQKTTRSTMAEAAVMVVVATSTSLM
jgi:hypothetical protein